MNLQDVKTVKFTKVLYVPRAMKNLLRVSRLVSKGALMGATHDKMIIKEKGVSMTLYTRKFQNKIMMFYLKSNIYAP